MTALSLKKTRLSKASGQILLLDTDTLLIIVKLGGLKLMANLPFVCKALRQAMFDAIGNKHERMKMAAHLVFKTHCNRWSYASLFRMYTMGLYFDKEKARNECVIKFIDNTERYEEHGKLLHIMMDTVTTKISYMQQKERSFSRNYGEWRHDMEEDKYKRWHAGYAFFVAEMNVLNASLNTTVTDVQKLIMEHSMGIKINWYQLYNGSFGRFYPEMPQIARIRLSREKN